MDSNHLTNKVFAAIKELTELREWMDEVEMGLMTAHIALVEAAYFATIMGNEVKVREALEKALDGLVQAEKALEYVTPQRLNGFLASVKKAKGLVVEVIEGEE